MKIVPRKCGACMGAGYDGNDYTCSVCQGHGKIVTCPMCGGSGIISGRYDEHMCYVCSGLGVKGASDD